MKVYHGSYIKIDSIDFTFCRKKRDFGKGFYVTKLLSQAEYWAARKGEDNDTEGVVTEFEFDEIAFEDEDFNVLRFDGYNAEWLDFIVKNRTNKKTTQAHDYDIIEGPVADDDIATKVYDYIKKNITQKQFLQDLTHRKPSHQICFCTLRSLQALEQDKAYIDSPKFHTGKKVVERLMLDNKIDEVQATDFFYNSETFEKLTDESTKLYQKSWQEIYKMLKNEFESK